MDPALTAAFSAALAEAVDDLAKLFVGLNLPPLVKGLLAWAVNAGYLSVTNVHLFGGSGALAVFLNSALAYVLSNAAHKL